MWCVGVYFVLFFVLFFPSAILLSCTRAQQAFRPTVGYQQPRSSHLDGADDGDGKNNDDFSSLGSQRRLALDHAVTLFLVIERYATYAPSGVTKGGGEVKSIVQIKALHKT